MRSDEETCQERERENERMTRRNLTGICMTGEVGLGAQGVDGEQRRVAVPRTRRSLCCSWLQKCYQESTRSSSWIFSSHLFDSLIADFSTMLSRLKSGSFYITKHIFEADVRRICDNCRTYNRQDTPYYHCANSIEKLMRSLLRDVTEVPLVD